MPKTDGMKANGTYNVVTTVVIWVNVLNESVCSFARRASFVAS